MLSLPLEGEPSTVALEGNLLRTACAFIESEGALVGPWRLEEGCALRRMETTSTLPLADAQSRMAAIEFVDGESARVIVAENEAGFFPLKRTPSPRPSIRKARPSHKAARRPTWPRKPRKKLPRPSAPARPGFRATGSLPVR